MCKIFCAILNVFLTTLYLLASCKNRMQVNVIDLSLFVNDK